MGMKKTGDWDEVRKLIDTAPQRVQAINQRSLQRVGLKAERMAVKFIKNQSLSWAPLNPAYLKWKLDNNKSEKTLVSDSTYFQSITSIVEKNVAFAGVSKKVKNADGDTVADIARIHEFGSVARNIPARPLWGVVFKHIKTFVVNKNFFAREVINELKS